MTDRMTYMALSLQANIYYQDMIDKFKWLPSITKICAYFTVRPDGSECDRYSNLPGVIFGFY